MTVAGLFAFVAIKSDQTPKRGTDGTDEQFLSGKGDLPMLFSFTVPEFASRDAQIKKMLTSSFFFFFFMDFCPAPVFIMCLTQTVFSCKPTGWHSQTEGLSSRWVGLQCSDPESCVMCGRPIRVFPLTDITHM